MTSVLLVAAVALGGGLGVVAGRRGGWSAGAHRLALVALMMPWFAQHASVARLARSPSLNPVRRAVEPADVLLADLLGPVLVVAAVVACLVWVRRLRMAAALVPLLAEVVLWWVTIPLYHRLTLRGWFFLTEGLAGPWPFAYHVAAAAFLAGFALRPGPTAPSGAGAPPDPAAPGPPR